MKICNIQRMSIVVALGIVFLVAAILPSGAEAYIARSTGTTAYASTRPQTSSINRWFSSLPAAEREIIQPLPQPEHRQTTSSFSSHAGTSRSGMIRTYFGSSNQPAPNPAPQPPEPAPEPQPPELNHPHNPPDASVTLNSQEQLLFNLVNQERINRGLEPLKLDGQLVYLARLKSQDMIDNKYFAHESPVYGRSGDMLRNAGIRFVLAAENIGIGGNINAIFSAFMDSSGHRNKITGSRYTHTGIGVIYKPGRGYLVTQLFIQPR